MELNRESIDGLTTTTILDDDVFYSLLEVADPIDRERALQDLQRRAKEVGRKTEFERLRKVFEREQRQMEASNAATNAQLNSPILLKYTEKGVPAATIDNFAAILNNDPELKDKFWLDELSMTPEREVNGEMQRWTDADDSWLRGYIERKYRIYSPPKLLDALETVWQAHRYHPIRDRIKSLTWDGRPRLKRMLIKWLHADDCPYSEEVSRLIFAGGIHRVFEPGCKFEDMAVLIGQKQGEGKSTFVRMLAMDDKFFREVNEIDGQRGSEAVEGAWIEAPGYAVLDTLYERLPGLQLVAEDLGDLRPEVLQLRDHYHLPGMKVLEFTVELTGKRARDTSPDVTRQIVYTGTHDNATVVEWYESLTIPQRRKLRRYLKERGAVGGQVYQRMVRLALKSKAELAVIPVQDVLGLGKEARMNLPGTVGAPNWQWRLKDFEALKKAMKPLAQAIKETKRA